MKNELSAVLLTNGRIAGWPAMEFPNEIVLDKNPGQFTVSPEALQHLADLGFRPWNENWAEEYGQGTIGAWAVHKKTGDYQRAHTMWAWSDFKGHRWDHTNNRYYFWKGDTAWVIRKGDSTENLPAGCSEPKIFDTVQELADFLVKWCQHSIRVNGGQYEGISQALAAIKELLLANMVGMYRGQHGLYEWWADRPRKIMEIVPGRAFAYLEKILETPGRQDAREYWNLIDPHDLIAQPPHDGRYGVDDQGRLVVSWSVQHTLTPTYYSSAYDPATNSWSKIESL